MGGLCPGVLVLCRCRSRIAAATTSWIVDRGSWIVDRGSWIVDRGSWSWSWWQLILDFDYNDISYITITGNTVIIAPFISVGHFLLYKSFRHWYSSPFTVGNISLFSSWQKLCLVFPQSFWGMRAKMWGCENGLNKYNLIDGHRTA